MQFEEFWKSGEKITIFIHARLEYRQDQLLVRPARLQNALLSTAPKGALIIMPEDQEEITAGEISDLTLLAPEFVHWVPLKTKQKNTSIECCNCGISSFRLRVGEIDNETAIRYFHIYLFGSTDASICWDAAERPSIPPPAGRDTQDKVPENAMD